MARFPPAGQAAVFSEADEPIVCVCVCDLGALMI